MLKRRLEPSFSRNITFLLNKASKAHFLFAVFFVQQNKNLTFAPKLVLNISD